MTTRMESITGPRADVGFPVLDADGHVAEPHDLWSRYCDPSHRQAATDALAVVDLPDGGSGLMLEGRCLVRGIEAVTFAGQNPRTFLGTRRWDEGYPGAFDPVHRLRDMDLEAIDVAMVFPSMVGALGGVSDSRLAAAMARAGARPSRLRTLLRRVRAPRARGGAASISVPGHRMDAGHPARPRRRSVQPRRHGRDGCPSDRQHADHGLPDVRRGV